MIVRWLSIDVVFEFHAEQLETHGGGEGLRDLGRLEAAVARPGTMLSYEPDADLEKLAAAYAHGIAKGHPFVDGNKRTAWVVARTFLKKNGLEISGSQDERYEKMYALASGDLTEEEFADWLRGVTVERDSVPTK